MARPKAKTKGKGTILYSREPEFYGYRWKTSDGYPCNEYGTRWDPYGPNYDINVGLDQLLENLPKYTNGIIVAGPEVRYYDSLLDAIRGIYRQGGYDSDDLKEVSAIDGDLYVHGYLVRELTDRGQEWWDDNARIEGVTAANIYCLNTSGYTRKIFGKTGGKPQDRSAYYDSDRHPMHGHKGPLYTIDRGSGYEGPYRYVGGLDENGFERGAVHRLAVYRREGDYFSAADEARKGLSGMKPGETRTVMGYEVTRVRNVKPKKLVGGTRKHVRAKTTVKGSATRTKAGKPVSRRSAAKKGAGR